jgi:hypothetical protein
MYQRCFLLLVFAAACSDAAEGPPDVVTTTDASPQSDAAADVAVSETSTPDAAPDAPPLPGRPIPRPYMGFNAEHHQAPGWTDSTFKSAVASLGAEVMRYPGGKSGNYWHYQNGCAWPIDPNDQSCVDSDVATEGKVLQGMGTSMVYVPNMLMYGGKIATSADDAAQLTDQLGLLSTAANAGLDVSLIELGNEFYHLGDDLDADGTPDYKQRFASASDYVALANTWISALRPLYPKAKIAAVGASLRDAGDGGARLQTWTASMLDPKKGLVGEDAITMHVYIGMNDPMPGVEEFLGMPELRHQSMEANDLTTVATLAPTLPVWITEFNVDDMTAKQEATGNWEQALFIASMFTHFVSEPRISLVMFHNITGGGSAINATSIQIAPCGLVAQTFIGAEKKSVNVEPVTVAGAPTGTTTGGAKYPTVLETVFWSASGPTGILVNLGASPYVADVSSRFAGTVNVTTTTAQSLTKRMQSAADANLVKATAQSASSAVTLPAYSLVVVQ